MQFLYCVIQLKNVRLPHGIHSCIGTGQKKTNSQDAETQQWHSWNQRQRWVHKMQIAQASPFMCLMLGDNPLNWLHCLSVPTWFQVVCVYYWSSAVMSPVPLLFSCSSRVSVWCRRLVFSTPMLPSKKSILYTRKVWCWGVTTFVEINFGRFTSATRQMHHRCIFR